MAGFKEKNNILHIDDIPVPDIAAQVGTPAYIYSAGVIKNQYEALAGAMDKVFPAGRKPMLCYACKANSNIAVLKLMNKLGSGLEIVSEGELFRGLKAGFKGGQIISTSFGKNDAEIAACLKADIHQFNVESDDELNNINRIAGEMNKKADVAFRLNPDIGGGAHDKITTGRKEDKFGNTEEKVVELYRRATSMDSVTPVGLSVHIGSQVTKVEAFKPAYIKLAGLVKKLRSENMSVKRLDIGGGFPIIYNNEDLLDLDAYASWVADIILPLDTEIQMEPGRYMVGNSGILLSEVLYVKQTPSKNFIVLDAAMNDLIRPSLYDAYHGIRTVENTNNDKTVCYDVVGPVCESGDVFAKDRKLPEVNGGDLIAIESAGAYGFSMASNYNSRPLPAEIMVDGGKFSVIRPRQTLEQLIDGETIPNWLES